MQVNDVFVNYLLYGKKKGQTIVLLHGWGQNIDMMRPIGDNFADKYQVLIIDLPGFGKSSEPKYPWTLDDYVNALHELFTNLKIEKPIVMGHSFGGKLSLLYASRYETSKLVLFASPINHNHKVSLKSKILKQIKKLPLMDSFGEYMKKYLGSTDYKNSSPIMRKILVNHVSYDIYDKLESVKVPTLIIWGENDITVDPSVAYEIDSVLKDSGVVMLPGTHYAYLENLNHVNNILESFLEG